MKIILYITIILLLITGIIYTLPIWNQLSLVDQFKLIGIGLLLTSLINLYQKNNRKEL